MGIATPKSKRRGDSGRSEQRFAFGKAGNRGGLTVLHGGGGVVMEAQQIRQTALSVILLGITVLVAQAQECQTKGRIESFGQGTPGMNGVPALVHVGVPLQKKAFWFELTNGRPGAFGLILGSQNEGNLYLPGFGATLYPAPPFFLQAFNLDGEGESAPLFQLPTVPNLCGLEFVTQAVVFDQAGKAAKAFSNAMRIGFGGPARGSPQCSSCVPSMASTRIAWVSVAEAKELGLPS